jgi:hypothetical protein
MKTREGISIPFVWERWGEFGPGSEPNRDRSAVEGGGLERIMRGFGDH